MQVSAVQEGAKASQNVISQSVKPLCLFSDKVYPSKCVVLCSPTSSPDLLCSSRKPGSLRISAELHGLVKCSGGGLLWGEHSGAGAGAQLCWDGSHVGSIAGV